ncbi:hypothetical protein CJ20_094 [Escherichia phage CJ20]|nr:hypothetical protein CJ20_094 [Escherichia phage CJ20]
MCFKVLVPDGLFIRVRAMRNFTKTFNVRRTFQEPQKLTNNCTICQTFNSRCREAISHVPTNFGAKCRDSTSPSAVVSLIANVKYSLNQVLIIFHLYTVSVIWVTSSILYQWASSISRLLISYRKSLSNCTVEFTRCFL